MIRWRRLLVLWLLCVTLPLQAVAALRTHCAPGTLTSAMSSAANSRSSDSSAMAMHAAHHAAMSADGDTMPVTHHHAAASGNTGSDAAHAMTGPAAPMHDVSSHASSAPSSHDTHSLHASCSACAACVVCTALPASVAVRTPDAQPSVAIPFLRPSATSADVAVPERPPKARAV